jgi:hypothetical protein
VPVIVGRRPEAATELDGYGLEARWRLGSADPAKAGPLVALLRAGARRQIPADALRLEGGATLSLDLGRLRAVADAGVVYASDGGEVSSVFGAGLSYRVAEELFVGVESYGVARFGENGTSWFSVGPNLSFTWGRFWLTASLPIGIDDDAPDLLPRVIWATAF